MAGGILQLVAYGAQDIQLTADPQITFFKIVYRQYSNFSMETFEEPFDSFPNFGKKSSIKIRRLGDLVTKLYLKVVINQINSQPNAKFSWVKKLGFAMIEKVQILIGETVIEEQFGTWLHIWFELTYVNRQNIGHDKLIGNVDELTKFNNMTKPQYTLFIPLQFWFNKHYGLALPLISIQYSEVYFNVQFESNEKLIVRNNNFVDFTDVTILSASLLIDYVYLDLEERRKFSLSGHDYLVEISQFFGNISLNNFTMRTKLDFNFPTKELFWFMRNGNYISGKEFLCYTNNDWNSELHNCSKQIISNSLLILPDNQEPIVPGNWNEILSSSTKSFFDNNIIIQNNNSNSVWFNTTSLIIQNGNDSVFNIIQTIKANVVVSENDVFIIDVISGISEHIASIPVERMTDTRIQLDNVIVYQFDNFGLFITGNVNPSQYSLIEYNGENRSEKRSGEFYGTLQPYIYHSGPSISGLNMYSFSIKPEFHQPIGTSNFSKIENIILTTRFTNNNLNPVIDILDPESKFIIFANSYNVFRVMSGIAALVYTN